MIPIEEAVLAIARGDRRAFEMLYRSQAGRLTAYAMGLLAGDRAAAEDVIAVSFLAIWQGAAGWARTGSAEAWIRQIVRHKAIDWLRANARHGGQADEEVLLTLADPQADPELQAIEADSMARLISALTQLNIDQREAVMLCYFEGLGLGEIARIAGCPQGTVKSRLFHARLALRSQLARDPLDRPGRHDHADTAPDRF